MLGNPETLKALQDSGNQEAILQYICKELAVYCNSASDLNNKVIEHETKMKYFTRKDIEQNGTLKTLVTKVNTIDLNLEQKFNDLHTQFINGNLVLEQRLYAHITKQNWTLITIILIPTLLMLCSKFIINL